MSTRSSNVDRHASEDITPRRQMVEPGETPIDLLNLAAALLDQHGAASSECRACADRLRKLVRALAQAQRR